MKEETNKLIKISESVFTKEFDGFYKIMLMDLIKSGKKDQIEKLYIDINKLLENKEAGIVISSLVNVLLSLLMQTNFTDVIKNEM